MLLKNSSCCRKKVKYKVFGADLQNTEFLFTSTIDMHCLVPFSIFTQNTCMSCSNLHHIHPHKSQRICAFDIL